MIKVAMIGAGSVVFSKNLTGKQVHKNDVGRGHTANSDSATVYLKPGINRILVKVDNYVGGWGFSVSIPKAAF